MICAVRKKCAGFSMTELIIYITIVGLLTVTVGPPMFRWIFKAKRGKAEQALQGFKQGLQQYKLDVGTYPQALVDIVKKPSAVNKWDGPYVDVETVVVLGKSFVDPWDNPYQYKFPGSGHPFELFSNGNPEKPEKIDVWEIR